MTKLLIVNEFSCGDLPSVNSMDTERGTLYHLEPFPSRLKGWQNRDLRERIRIRTFESGALGQANGILPVAGPFFFQQQVLLGWVNREGTSLWHSPYHPEEDQRLLGDLSGLLTSYRIYHRQGFPVGQPVWERIYRDDRGIFFPDPLLIGELPKPTCNLPPGLTGCHPPERFHPGSCWSLAADHAADIFYLGILFYWLLTGKLPYRLTGGWPTQAILAGEQIPLWINQPEINRAYGEIVDSMLADDPAKRPSAGVLAEKWCDAATVGLRLRAGRLSAKDAAEHRGLKKVYLRRRIARQLLNRCRTVIGWGRQRLKLVLILTFLLIFICFGLSICLTRPSQPPSRAVRDFYRSVSVPTAFYAGDDGITRGYFAERNKRFEAARQILNTPLVHLDRLRIGGGARDNALCAEAELSEWHWTGAGWQKTRRTEQLWLKKTGPGWRIVARESKF